MVWSITWAGLAALSGALTLWQWLAARRFPLHRRFPDRAWTRGVSVLKPLKGTDAQTEQCLRSWFEQEYRGPVQLLFGVADPNDPACALVQQLTRAYPKAGAELVICADALGSNAKVSSLAQLRKHAVHEIVVVSDADVRVPRDLLAQLTPMLAGPGVGLVNCFYEMANAVTPAMQWEAVAVNADFWSQVLQARQLKPVDFALGAVMATTAAQLEKIGGFEALLDYLADDYQLGHRIARQGARIDLCPLVVQCWSGPLGWRAVWQHQLRWTRTIRVCQPLPFFFSILSNATLWPLLWLALDPGPFSLAGSLLLAGLRILTARSNQARLTQRRVAWSNAGFVLWKDLAGAVLWLLAFTGSRIEWRGQKYRMLRDGRLEPERVA